MKRRNGILSMGKDEAVALRAAVRNLLVAETAALNEGPHALARRVLILSLSECVDDLTSAIHYCEIRQDKDPESENYVIPHVRPATVPIWWAAIELARSIPGEGESHVTRLTSIANGL